MKFVILPLASTPTYLLPLPVGECSLSPIIFRIASPFATSWAFQICDNGSLAAPSQLPQLCILWHCRSTVPLRSLSQRLPRTPFPLLSLRIFLCRARRLAPFYSPQPPFSFLCFSLYRARRPLLLLRLLWPCHTHRLLLLYL